RLKTLWRWLTTKKPKAPLFPERELVPEWHMRKPTPDELALGFAASDNLDEGKAIRQLKGISQADRDVHFYVVGASRTGKTKFLEYLIKQDIENGLGFCVIDPHGDFTEDIKGYLYALNKDDPESLQERVVLIDPTDKTNIATFNPLETTDKDSAEAIVLELTDAFKKIWADAWGARLEDLLKNTLIALVENNLTLGELPLFLTNSDVRHKVLEKVKHEGCRLYFRERFDNLRRSEQNERMESTLNKVSAFLFDPALRQMLVASKSSFNFREIMDEGKILLVKLAKGQFKSNADLLGSLLLAKIQATAFARTDTRELQRRKFYLYIDEFQNFATESFKNVLAESSKYKLPLILAHQELAQLPTPLRASILSNCGIQAYFRISRDDANILAKESLTSIYSDPPGWESYIQALQELKRRECVVKNKIVGGVIAIRTDDLLPPHEFAEMDEEEFVEEVRVAEIGKHYLRERQELEDEYIKRREELVSLEDPKSFREPKKKDNKPILYVPAEDQEDS
ncbi:MAG: type IV secretion system DNA-binding domain-containing protein, partial [Candidatus Wildermuthbacteria bacterium]|nr:type IV secretion system DNA-binding domain-containing protein [Candidatus Wildermuthbacteria bacterium]